ncbi:MAG: SPFH domain-containing protein [Pirellulaceae bacterium]
MNQTSKELQVTTRSGWLMLAVVIAVFLAGLVLIGFFIYTAAVKGERGLDTIHIASFIVGILTIGVGGLLCNGFFTLQPNAARVLILFGKYVGTERKSGWHWTNPFNTKPRVSMRSRNFNTQTLKVNDKQGNPIEIGAVIVWKVCDTAQASFDVDSYEEYVEVQSEAALRQLANNFAYDHGEEGETTLRCGLEEVSNSLQNAVQARLARAGVQVEETRISHLAYAPEIASAMLKRQQAEAIIAARQKIVHGAVSMVEMALTELDEGGVISLDEERKASMISNLLVVLCSESEAQPVLNTGTLYQ